VLCQQQVEVALAGYVETVIIATAKSLRLIAQSLQWLSTVWAFKMIAH